MESIERIVRGSVWLYGSSIVSNLGGFIYWLLISRIAGSALLGLTSATVGLAVLISAVLNLGISIGIQHFLGLCLGKRDRMCFHEYLWTGVLFSLILYLLAGALLISLGLLGYGFTAFDPAMMTYAGLIVSLNVMMVIQSAAIALLRTDLLFMATVFGNIMKIGLGVLLVSLGYGLLGAVIGYLCVPVAVIVMISAHLLRITRWSMSFSLKVLRELLRGSIVSWLPNVVLIGGQWIGVLAIFGSKGEVETGHYYVAFVISNFILGIGIMMVNLLLPVLSSMRKEREVATSRVLRLSLAVMIPVATFIAAYPFLPFLLLGREYVDASTALSVLLLSSVPLTVYFAVNSLVYSHRRYLDVLYLGLSQNIPRLILYLLLVPVLGGLGAAISFTAGSFTGLAHAVLLAKKIGFRIGWSGIGKAIGMPALFIIVAYFAGLPWPVGLVLTLVSYILYGRLGVLRREDVRDLARALLGEELAAGVYVRARWLIDYIFSS